MNEGLSVEEVCDELLAELAAQAGDETALAEVEMIDFGSWGRAIEDAAKEVARRTREAAEYAARKAREAAEWAARKAREAAEALLGSAIGAAEETAEMLRD